MKIIIIIALLVILLVFMLGVYLILRNFTKKIEKESYIRRIEIKAEKQRWLKERKTDYEECDRCGKTLTVFDNYQCRYCGRILCGLHRIPERHDCENPKLPHDMKIDPALTYPSDGHVYAHKPR